MLSFFIIVEAFAQNLDKVYGEFTNSNDSVILGDYVTCNSNLHHIVGLCAVREGNLVTVRFLEFDTLGLVSQSKKISPSGNYTKFFPLDVKPLDNKQGYIVVGYAWKLDAAVPWICKIDNLGNIIVMKNLLYGGFFSRVEELNNGNFVFIGSHIGSLVPATPFREAFYTTTDNNFKLINSQILPSASTLNKFDNFNDIVEVENNEVVIAGCYTANLPATNQSRFVIFRVNPDIGGIIIWQASPFVSNFTSPKLIVAGDTIYSVVNNLPNSVSELFKFHKNTGVFYGGFVFEVVDTGGCVESSKLLHNQIVQDLYYDQNGFLFVSGKLLTKYSEMPFDIKYKISNGQVIKSNFYEEIQNFNELVDFTGYKAQPVSGVSYFALQTRSSTIQYNDSCFSTLTYCTNNNGFSTPVFKQKTWLFSNFNLNVHGRHSTRYLFLNLGMLNYDVVSLDSLFIPGLENSLYQIVNLTMYVLDCTKNYPCNCNN